MKVFQNARALKKFFSVALLSYPVCNTLRNLKQTYSRLRFSCVVNEQLGQFLITKREIEQLD